VVILPPWWRTNWFYFFCALALILVVVGTDRLRARHLEAKSRELEKIIRERTRELEVGREQLRVRATHDALTGLPNRVEILRLLEIEKERVLRTGKTTVVALVDLDYFKHINDAFGHPAGDEALRHFVAAITAAIRPYDHAGRWGGEEFLLVLSDVPLESAEKRLVEIHASISNLHIYSGESKIVLNCSVGGVLYDAKAGHATNESLISLADKALYAAKSAGRNRVVISAQFQTDLTRRA
jgi:diguanylate cyclase (GGDEF)-like protein